MRDLYNLQYLDEIPVESILREMSIRKEGIESDLLWDLAERLFRDDRSEKTLQKKIDELEDELYDLKNPQMKRSEVTPEYIQCERQKIIDQMSAGKVGSKVKFKGVPEFYWPCYTNVKEDAEKYLVVGQEYTITKFEVYSSWCSVELEGIPGFYHSYFFE